ncbi:hypothetical protein ACFV3E_12810 [Streptomyces sp. NPDC059718]
MEWTGWTGPRTGRARRRAEAAAWTAGLVLGAFVGVRVIQHLLAADVAPASVASRGAVLGTWATDDGDGSIRFDPDGHFSASRMPAQVFTPGRWVDGVKTTGGTWTFHHRYVELDGFSGLGIVEDWRDDTRLCVESGDPGVLCDELLHRVPG